MTKARHRSLARARWQCHVNAVRAPEYLRQWLTDRGSLTARLVARSTRFRVQRLHQRLGVCLPDECGAIGLQRQGKVWEREVLLRCDEAAVVFAHTVVPMSATVSDWPRFYRLGERSLGTTLFGDKRVVRGRLQFARLARSHPLRRRIEAALGRQCSEGELYARRSLFYRRRSHLLVTEVFLPALAGLAAQPMARAA